MATANGKVILCGEHAVVYGVPAIAAGIERGARAQARRADASRLVLGNDAIQANDGSDVGKAFGALLATLDERDVEVRLEVDVPPGCGLGASAAMAVATARAVLELAAEPPSPERVLEAATAWERVFHGNPSGIDAAAAAARGCILFSRSEGARPVKVLEPLVLAVAVAGPPASTKVMVDSVAALKARRPEVVDKALEGIRSVVSNARLCIEHGDVIGLGRLMDLNQMLLAGLFVSTEEIENACAIARTAGALGAKLTGAGGGGAVIALCEESADAVLAAWRSAGIECFGTRVRETDR
ncbi:MAG: mevalonate kinase [Myxococcales bacterium]|nr:mevalonate kinase [Myxococcales bacterium]MCB9578063.1 mevalonate kinase [Polyangiaceae bacterium]